jgi:hypothetical protein
MPTETLEISDTSEIRELLSLALRKLNSLDRKLQHPAGSERRGSARSVKPYDFFVRVQVEPTSKSLETLRGKVGTVRGRARGRQGWTYAVFIDDLQECWSVHHHELKLLGKQEPKASNGHTAPIRVRVDSKGRGHIVH